MNRARRVGLHRLTVGSALGMAAALLLVATVSAGGARPQLPPTIVVTETDDDGPGSLRQAIREAPPGAVVQLAPTLAQKTIVLVTGQLVIRRNLTIDASQAPGVVISADQHSRVLRVESGAEVHLIGLTLTGGRAPDALPPPGSFGGGILNLGTLTLTNCVVTGNRAGDGASGCIWNYEGNTPGGHGGGIYNLGRLRLINSTVSNNRGGNGRYPWEFSCPLSEDGREGEKIGKGGSGGGIYNAGITEIVNSRITNNIGGTGSSAYNAYTNPSVGIVAGTGGDGGGLFNVGVASIADSTIANNVAGEGGSGSYIFNGVAPPAGEGGAGGGIYNVGTLLLARSAIIGNSSGKGSSGSAHTMGGAGGAGGGLYNHRRGVATVVNCTFYNNETGAGGKGGHAYIYGECEASGGDGGDGAAIANAGSLWIQSCTIYGNKPGPGGLPGTPGNYPWCLISPAQKGRDGLGGGFYGDTTLLSSIVAGNSGGDCVGNVLVGGHNLIQNPDGCTVAPSAYHNIVGSNPKLGTLRIEAPGYTPTLPLLPGSPAIDAAPCNPDVPTDQRGVPRPQGAGCDIGAYEYEPLRWRLIWLPR